MARKRSSGAPEATPAAEELADEAGVDLESVEGTGLHGKVTKGDVEAAIEGDASGGEDTQEIVLTNDYQPIKEQGYLWAKFLPEDDVYSIFDGEGFTTISNAEFSAKYEVVPRSEISSSHPARGGPDAFA